jgi:membrane associated rhomboid family serine protease
VTPWVLRLIVANTLVFLLQQTVPGLGNGLALVPAMALTRPWTLVTYMFLHGGLGHLFFNMLSLFFFGPVVEGRLGSRHFLRLYLISGLTGALLSILFPRSVMGAMIPIIGASGAVFGINLAFAYFWPRQQILIWGILPIEARWLVAIMTVVSLYYGFVGPAGGVAHLAHLGGFLGGFLYLKWMERRQQAPMRQWREQSRARVPKVETSGNAIERWSKIRRDNLHEVNRSELDRILDKISASGITSLTPGEREFLDRFSSRA